jgi:hypothetical protein
VTDVERPLTVRAADPDPFLPDPSAGAVDNPGHPTSGSVSVPLQELGRACLGGEELGRHRLDGQELGLSPLDGRRLGGVQLVWDRMTDGRNARRGRTRPGGDDAKGG